MRIKLSVAGKEIASVPIDAGKAKNWDYLQAKRRLLTTMHFLKIQQEKEPPVYYIQVSSKMNK
jgi:hypothetical protein